MRRIDWIGKSGCFVFFFRQIHTRNNAHTVRKYRGTSKYLYNILLFGLIRLIVVNSALYTHLGYTLNLQNNQIHRYLAIRDKNSGIIFETIKHKQYVRRENTITNREVAETHSQEQGRWPTNLKTPFTRHHFIKRINTHPIIGSRQANQRERYKWVYCRAKQKGHTIDSKPTRISKVISDYCTTCGWYYSSQMARSRIERRENWWKWQLVECCELRIWECFVCSVISE